MRNPRGCPPARAARIVVTASHGGTPPPPRHPAATVAPRRNAIHPSRFRPIASIAPDRSLCDRRTGLRGCTAAAATPAPGRFSRPGSRAVATALVAVAVALLSATAGAAQERDRHRDDDLPLSGSGLVVLDLATSVAAAGFGGAFPAAGNGGFAIFHHPALIRGEGFGLAAGSTGYRHGSGHPESDCHREHGDHGHCAGDDDHDHNDHAGPALALSASGAWLGGTVAAGLALARNGAESLAAIGHARTLFGFRVGAAAKLVAQQSPGHGSTAHAAALDLGLAREFGWLATVLTVQNLGPDLRHSDHRTHLAQRAVLAAATDRTPLGPLDIGGALQVAVERGGRIVPGGGLELSYWPIQRRVFVGRIGGLRTRDDGSPITFGAGFEGDRIRLDYAFIDADPALGPHRIGVAIR